MTQKTVNPKTNPEAEAAMQESEDRFKYAFEHSVIGNSITLLTGEVQVNQALCEMLGYSRSELQNKTWQEITHPDDIELTQNEINLLLSGRKKSARFNKRFIHKNGSIIWTELGSTLRRDQDGKPLYLITSISDISKRKEAEAALEENKTTAEKYLNIAAEIIVSLDTLGNIVLLNDSGHHLLGYNSPELIGKNWFETCVPEEDRIEVSRFFEMLAKGEVSALDVHENCVVTKTGEKKIILWHNTLLRDQDDRFIGSLSSGEDITERIEMEKSLRIALAKYKTLFESFPLGVTITDVEGNVLETNPTAAKLLGVSRDEHIRRKIGGSEWHIIRPDGTPMPPEEFASVQALEGKCLVENVEMGIVKSGQEITWLSVTAAPLPVERHGVVITYGDITARKRDVEKLRESEERFHAMFEKHDAVMLLIEPRTGAIHDANQSAIKFYGYPKPKLCRMNINDINTLSPEQVALERQKALNEDRNYLIFRHKLANGEERSVEVHSSPIHFQDQPMLFSIIHDITARKKAEDEIQARLRLRQYAESLTLDELLQMTLDEAEALTGSQIGFAHFLEADQKTLDLQMWSTNTLKNMCSAEGRGQHYPVDQAGVWVDCIYARAPMIHNDYASLPHRKGMPPGHAPVTRELVVPVMQGNLIVAIFGVGNKPSDYTDDDVEAVLQLANLTWDIVLRKRAEEALKVSERKHRMLHESMIDGFVKIDMSGKIQEYNQVFRDMLGYSETELVCLTYMDITPEKWHAFELEIVENQILKRGYSDIYEKEYRRKDGTIFPVELRVVLLRDEQDKLTGMWAIVRDITKRKQADDTLETAYAELKESLIREKQLAHTDMLTGVNNRRNLYAIAAHELDIAIRYQQPLSIMMFDLDQFKKVNDTFGHTVGDQVLVQVTQAACAELRSADAIGRYGGEEFVILLPVTSALQAYPLAERIRERAAAIRVPTPIGDAAVTLSIGIIEMIQTQTPGESLDDMIRRADQAMYAAKQAGRNCTVVVDGDGIRKKPD